MPISIHTIRAANVGGLPYVEVPVSGWGNVRLQRLQPQQKDQFASLLAGSPVKPGGLFELVCATAVDDGGAPLFSVADRSLLDSRPDAVALLGDAAVKLNTSAAVGVKDSASITE